MTNSETQASSACDMRHVEPYDFAWCETHDTTFALGDKCKFDGRVVWEVYAEEADEQRGLKVRAEVENERLRAVVMAAEYFLANDTSPRCGVCSGHSPHWDGHSRDCPRGALIAAIKAVKSDE